MKVLVIGSGGREHAIVWKLKQSPLVDKIYCAPGNAGIEGLAECVNIKVDKIEELLQFALLEKIDLTIVGPEDPLSKGIVDLFEAADLKIFGPSKAAAELESSKVFTKELAHWCGVPTAFFKKYTDHELAKYCVRSIKYPLVVKADGLAAGKGVIICQSRREAYAALEDIMVKKKFKEAGDAVIIEDFLEGEEASYIVLVDKNGHVLPLASSQDHKRVGDGDEGPNTGGMGAYSPAPVMTPEVERKTLEKIIYPVVQAMAERGTPFAGFLYAGLMIKDGEPSLLEFNVRLGDPETQPLMVRMKSDLMELILAALEGNLDKCQIEWHPEPAVCVVMASEGYPGSYEKGGHIFGVFNSEKNGAVVFHAGTAFNVTGELVTAGGRVLGVTAMGNAAGDFSGAKVRAYEAVEKIECAKLFYRTDIADRAINRE